MITQKKSDLFSVLPFRKLSGVSCTALVLCVFVSWLQCIQVIVVMLEKSNVTTSYWPGAFIHMVISGQHITGQDVNNGALFTGWYGNMRNVFSRLQTECLLHHMYVYMCIFTVDVMLSDVTVGEDSLEGKSACSHALMSNIPITDKLTGIKHSAPSLINIDFQMIDSLTRWPDTRPQLSRWNETWVWRAHRVAQCVCV